MYLRHDSLTGVPTIESFVIASLLYVVLEKARGVLGRDRAWRRQVACGRGRPHTAHRRAVRRSRVVNGLPLVDLERSHFYTNLDLIEGHIYRILARCHYIQCWKSG